MHILPAVPFGTTGQVSPIRAADPFGGISGFAGGVLGRAASTFIAPVAKTAVAAVANSVRSVTSKAATGAGGAARAIGAGAMAVAKRATGVASSGPAKSASQYADELAAAGKERGAVSRMDLTDGGPPIYGESGSARVFHPDMQAALDSLPSGIRKMRISGGCAEIACINDALTAGRSPAGAVIETRAVGKTPPGHGRPKAPCPTCARVLPHFGVEAAG